jgi:protein involved in polysaccharide export with SLBB domain
VAPASNLPVDPDYKLGPGDNLILYVWNIPGTALYDSATFTIDRAGSAFIPRIGSVPLQGLTVAQAQEVIRGRVARNYSGFELRVALGELRAISVYVVGEVARPGTYTISPFSTVLDALFVAGGPSKMGSLRSIRVTQTAGSVREVDLYDFLLRGERPTGPMLQAGDLIFVPPIGPVSGVTGEVKRPGIYELRPGTTAGALIAMAGGPLPSAQLDRVQMERTQGTNGRIILDLPFEAGRGRGGAEMLQDGDLLTVFPSSDYLRNVVTVEGFVRVPGQYEWKPGLRLSDILTPETVLPEAHREKVEVVRVRPDFSREVLTVNLRDLWALSSTPDPTHNLELRPQDRIGVYSEVIGPKAVTVNGEVKRPGKYFITPGERLSSALERAGGFLPTAFLKGAIFIRESLRRREQVELEKFVQVQTQSVLAEGAAISAGAAESGRPEFAASQSIIASQRRELMQSLTQVVTLGRLSIHLDTPERLKGTTEDIELEDGDFLFIPNQPVTVSILGAVRSATAVLYKEGETVEYYVARAGGATKQADPKEIYILKADGSAQASFVKMRQLEPGDAVVVPLSTEAKIPTIMIVKDFATIIGNLAIPFGVIAGLFK